ncbi:TPA: ATP-binding domain-containing protein [Candidatus Avigastranaerophilus faecigallinarum]|nr:ATP-binding domain-containing protein [Candidatus Avigastranaerophilus faecigallinarum]
MYLKNKHSCNIFNGSCGYVTDIQEESVTVKFDNGYKEKFYKEPFFYYENETYIGTRFQIPFILAYAITIHKAQGLTLDEVVIDCRSAFEHGQVYVALSRVKKLENLYILGFNAYKVYADKKAQLFYKKILENNKLDDLLFRNNININTN